MMNEATEEIIINNLEPVKAPDFIRDKLLNENELFELRGRYYWSIEVEGIRDQYE